MRPPAEIEGAFRARPADAHKRSVGVVSIVGGSAGYSSAPVIAALGARAAGAGLVQLVAPEVSRAGLAMHVPEATFMRLTASCVPPAADVMVAGMGLGKSLSTEMVVKKLLLGRRGRFVLDADALGVLALISRTQKSGFRTAKDAEIVLTPHEGEAARLLGTDSGEIAAARMDAAKEIARRYGATVVLKGPGTIVVSPDCARVWVNATGNPNMALGGMGDLLAGIVGARWAFLKGCAFEAACGAVWLHGAASDALIAAGGDPSIVNTAARVGALRAALDNLYPPPPPSKTCPESAQSVHA